MEVDTEILPFFVLFCFLCFNLCSIKMNLAIELCIFSQILIISCFANTFDGVSLSSQATHSGQVFTY